MTSVGTDREEEKENPTLTITETKTLELHRPPNVLCPSLNPYWTREWRVPTRMEGTSEENPERSDEKGTWFE